MESFFSSVEFTDVIVVICIFLLGYILGRVSGRARSSRKKDNWNNK